MFVLNQAQSQLFIKPIFGGDLNAYYMAEYLERSNSHYLQVNTQSMDGPSEYDYFGLAFNMDTFNQTVSIQGMPLFAFTTEVAGSNDEGDALESADIFFKAIRTIEDCGFIKWVAEEKAKNAKAKGANCGDMFSSSTQELLPDVSDYYIRWVNEKMGDDIARCQAIKQLGWALERLRTVTYEQVTDGLMAVNLPYSHNLKQHASMGGQSKFNKPRVPTTAHAVTVSTEEERTLKLLPWSLRWMLGLVKLPTTTPDVDDDFTGVM